MRLNLRIGTRLFLSHLLAILLVSGSMGAYFYHSAAQGLMDTLRNRLLNAASLAAESFDGRVLDTIRTPADMESPVYQDVLRELRRAHRTNPDLAFLYIMRRVGTRVEFVADSDNSEAQAKPGQVYDENLPALQEGFDQPAADEKLGTDAWGSFLSGYAPIRLGHDQYLLGVDMRAEQVRSKFSYLRVSGAVSLVCAVALAFLFSSVGARYFHGYLELFAQRCHAIAEGRFQDQRGMRTGSELDGLAEALDRMSDDVQDSLAAQRHAEAELRKLNESLEHLVDARTRELTEKNQTLTEALVDVKRLSGLLPICASCKKIRDDQGYWQRVEAYMQTHSEAKFTHSICPDCRQTALEDDEAPRASGPTPA
ncbi:MAG: hypothetical protein K8T26_13575 [Lentisphaerae bacterium]|nr:hypothetical protein [Lentisphaerota bacterium]